MSINRGASGSPPPPPPREIRDVPPRPPSPMGANIGTNSCSYGPAETSKILWIVKGFIKSYMFGLDLGCGKWKYPGSIGIDIVESPAVDRLCDAVAVTLPTVKVPDWLYSLKHKCDYIFSSHFLEDYEWKEIIRISQFYVDYFLKDDGYFIAYVPHKGKYKGTNLDHKYEFLPGDMENLISCLDIESVLIYYEAYHKPGMYGILGIGRK